MKVTLLGCGSSGGVPLIGCDCKVCTSKNPKNNRTRVSLFVEEQGKGILIDTSPDLRQQALRHNIRRIDGVLYTHEHADHTHGIDDLRSFNFIMKDSLHVYGNASTIELIQHRFPYVFLPKPENIWFRPSLVAHTLPEQPVHEFKIDTLPVTMFEQLHGKMKTVGYRIGKLGYSTDTDNIPDTAFDALAGIDTWIVDCLRYSESHSHSNLKKTLGWIERLKPRQAILTHLAHDFDYDTLKGELPSGVVPGYDGMIIEL